MSEPNEEASLFENAPVAFVYFDAALRIRQINRRAELLFGRRLDLVGCHIADLNLDGLDEATLRQALTNGEVKRLIHARTAAGDCYLDITCSPLPATDKQADAVLLTAVDVTARELALRQQARSEELQRKVEDQLASLLVQSEAERQRLFSVIDQMPEGVLIISAPHGGLLAINRTARDLLDAIDLTPGSTDYQELAMFGPDGSAWPYEVRPITRALHGETVIGAQVSVERRDGRRVDLLINASPLHDRSSGSTAISGAISVFQDISQLKELDRLKDDFISITSHELRTPLTTIKGYGQMMLRKLARLDPQNSILTELQKPLDTILERTERMIVMINDLLDVSRIATGRFEVLGRAVDLSSTIARCVEQARLVQPLPVELHAPDELMLVIGDERLIEQVLNNLLSNATKYSPGGGTITVTLAKDEANAIVRVEDEGIGIPLEQQERLFERFYRSERSKGVATGLGLGLYISNGIITAHGGRLWVESAGPGQGSTFCFTLPLAGLLETVWKPMYLCVGAHVSAPLDA